MEVRNAMITILFLEMDVQMSVSKNLTPIVQDMDRTHVLCVEME